MITTPGVYDIPEADYHADPIPGGSLSSTTARLLTPPSTPALARYQLDNPQHSDAFDLGSAAHALILGKGARIVEVVADDWKKPAVRALRDAARAEGKVPLLTKDLARARAMAAAVLRHNEARAILTDGAPERTLAWSDQRTGQWCRAMLDWWPDPARAWRLVIGDVKTSTAATAPAFAKKAAEYGYHQQAAHYVDGYAAVHGVDPAEVAFVFIVVQVDPPHIVNVVQLTDDAMAAGRSRNADALDTWQQCRETGVWPALNEGVQLVSLPRWAS